MLLQKKVYKSLQLKGKILKNLIYITLCVSAVMAQFDWQENGVPVRQGVHIEWQRTGDVGNNGEMIFVWSDTRNGGRDVYAQKVDSDGNSLWDVDGTVVVSIPGRQEDPIAVSDEAGGVYVIWTDYQFEPEDGDVFAQRVLSDGTLAWNEDGIPLSTVVGMQTSLNMCVDGLGGAFAIWNDLSSGEGQIYATHLSANGDVVSPGTGVPIITSPGGHLKVSIELGGAGYATMVWEDSRIEGEADIYTQRIDVNCNTLWSVPEEGGIPICNIQNVEQKAPKVTHVSGDTTVVVWEDYRNNIANGDIYIQYLDGDGNILLAENGFPLCNEDSKQLSPRVKANSEYAFVVWEDFRDHPAWADIYAQAFSLSDGLQWEEDGKPISTATRLQSQPRLTVDNNNGAYIVWMDERNAAFPEVEIYLQHVSASGDISFEDNGLAICDAPSYQFNPLVRTSGNDGSALILWGDSRTGSPGLYVQHVDLMSGITLTENGVETYFGIDGNAYAPKSLYLGNDKTLLYWEDYRGGGSNPQTYGQIISGEVGSNFGINGVKLSENPVQTIPKAVIVGDHIFLSFKSEDEWGTEIQAFQVLDFDLNLIGDPNGTVIYQNPFGMNQPFSKLVTGNDGYVYVAFSDIRSWDYDIYLQKYDELGNQQWEDGGVLITSADNDDNVEAVEPIPGGGCMVFWYGGVWNDLNVYCQAINGAGVSPEGWSNEPINISTAPGYQLDIKTAVLQNGVFSIWKDTRNDSTTKADIYGQVINFDGTIAGMENGFVITNEENDQKKPTLNMNNVQNEVLICWEDFVNGTDFDLVCKSFDPQTLSEGEEIVIAGEAGGQTIPFVSVSQSGSYLIIWEDTRTGGTSDIYLQEINASGAVFADGGIIVCNADFDQRNPGVVLYSETNNSYLMYWEDLRSSGKEFLWNIYAQSITTSSIVVDHLSEWNLVGLPVDVEDGSLSAVYPEGEAGTLYGFAGSYVNVDALISGEGYWLHFPNSGTTTITGSPITSLTVNLTAGWNLISGISEVTNVTDISDPGGIVIPGTAYGFTGSYTNASVFTPGHGYWINASADGDITISSGGTAKTRSAFTDRTVKANKLSFNGNDLYFGISIPEEEMLSYQLPPKPPEGAFDVRFADNMKVAENSGVIEIINNSDQLVIAYDIKDDTDWILAGNKEYRLSGSGEIIVSGDITGFTLNKVPEIPFTYFVSQNYPNPFNPVTRLQFEVGDQINVKLVIYDMLGRIVRTFEEKEYTPGRYTINWDGKDNSGNYVSSGTYIYRMKAGDFVGHKKMTLIR